MASTKFAFTSRPAAELAIPRFVAEHEAEEFEQTIQGKIGDRARLLFEESGCAPGNDEANWLRAESEILSSGLQVRESGSWVAINASLPEASARGVQILVRPKRVIVRARRRAEAEDLSTEGTKSDQEEILLATSLNIEVQPPSAVASFKDRNLKLMIKKSRPHKFLVAAQHS